MPIPDYERKVEEKSPEPKIIPAHKQKIDENTPHTDSLPFDPQNVITEHEVQNDPLDKINKDHYDK